MDENERGEPGSRTRPWHPIVPMDDNRQVELRAKIDDVLQDMGLEPMDDYGDYSLQSIRIDATEGRGDTNDLYYRITINVAEPWEPPPENTRAKGTHLRVVKENKKMKISKATLKKIIKEEIESVLTETTFDAIPIENEAATVEDILAVMNARLEKSDMMKGTFIYQLNRARHAGYKEKADAALEAMGWTDEAANHWSR
jgi:hypothetical protein